MQDYFKGNELARSVWTSKYALRHKGEQVESDPDQMHSRMAREFARAEQQYPNPVGEREIFESFRGFGDTIPQGSVMSMLGNPHQIGSLSNCIVVPKIYDSYGGIMYTDQQLAQLMKRRCVHELSEVLTPEGSKLIREVKVGDTVLALGEDGAPSFELVLDVFGEANERPKYIIKAAGVELVVTNDHPILVLQDGASTYREAEKLQIGDLLLKSFKGASGFETESVGIESITLLEDDESLFYDLTINKVSNFFTGVSGLVNVHNCGVGADLSTLRPSGAGVTNAAGTSTGVPSFMERFSTTTREVAQSGRN